jgi:predicted MFS family arabinose efflux permease
MLFVLNSGAQFVRPAVTAMVPGITEKKDLSTANSLFSLSTSVNQVAGYGIGGIIVLALGVAVPFYYDSLTFLFAAAMLSLITRSLGAIPKGVHDPNSLSSDHISFTEKFVQGLRFILSSKFLIQLVIVGLVVNFFGAGIFALLAPYAKSVISGNAGTYGAILTTYSVGAVIGSVLVGKLQLRNYVGKMLFAGVIGQGLVIVGIGFTTVLFLALALSFAIGVLQTMVNVPITVLVQTRVPGDILGESVQLPGGSSYHRCSGFVCARGGFGNFYLNWCDVPGFWRPDRASLRPGISVLQRFERRKLLTASYRVEP